MDDAPEVEMAWPDEVLMDLNAVLGHSYGLPDDVEFAWEEIPDAECEV